MPRIWDVARRWAAALFLLPILAGSLGRSPLPEGLAEAKGYTQAGFPLWSLQVGQTAHPRASDPALPHLYRIPVVITGYSSTPEETDETPFLTASNKAVQRGYLALSRDLLRSYTPGAPFAFGDLVEVVGVGVFQVEDTMASRYRRRADIWFEDEDAAVRWGVHHLVLARLAPGFGAGASTGLPAELAFAPAASDRARPL